jgi:antirestriction protein ArdC
MPSLDRRRVQNQWTDFATSASRAEQHDNDAAKALLPKPVGPTSWFADLVAGGPATAVTHRRDLPADVANLAAHSPALVDALSTVEDGDIRLHTGRGTFYRPDRDRIVVNPADHPDRASMVTALAHEAGHARHHARNAVPSTVDGALRDEGAAQRLNLRVVDELRAAGVTEPVAVAGGNEPLKRNIAMDAGDPKSAEIALGDWLGDHERPSTAPDLTYRQYYGRTP